MTEITRVPLQPIKKGSLTKLWLGVLLAVLVAAGLAWAAMPRGLDVETVTAFPNWIFEPPAPLRGPLSRTTQERIQAADKCQPRGQCSYSIGQVIIHINIM